MPAKLTLTRQLAEESIPDPSEFALSSLRRWLRPEDEARDAHGFVTLAAERAFPGMPLFDDGRIALRHFYAYCPDSVASMIDCQGDTQLWHRGKRYEKPALLIFCDAHQYTDIKDAAEFVYRRDCEAAAWFIGALADLPSWVYGPENWLGAVQMQFWRGEADEGEVRLEYEYNPEDFTGPTKAQVDESLPKWVWDAINDQEKARYRWRKHSRIRITPSPDEAVNNLRMIARLRDLGLEIDGLFSASGEPLALDPGCAKHVPNDTIDYPIRFGWTKGDWFERALDEMLEVASNAGFGTSYFAWHPAHEPARCAENFRTVTLPLIQGMVRLCVSIDRLKKQHSPLLIESLTADAKVKTQAQH